MRQFLLVVAATLVFAAAPAQAAEGATARSLSRLIVAGVAQAAQLDPNASAAKRACVAAIPGESLAAPVQGLVNEVLTAEEIATLDAFYASTLGIRFVDVGVRQITGMASEADDADLGRLDQDFDAAEQAAIDAAVKNDASTRLQAVATDMQQIGPRILPVLAPLLTACDSAR